jgi:hypothetical protein
MFWVKLQIEIMNLEIGLKSKILYLFIISLLIVSCNKQKIEEEKSDFKKISFYNGYYDAFGTLINSNDYLYYYTRRGLKHVGDDDSSIILMKINKDFKKKIKIKIIYKDFNKSIDVRNIAGGKIGEVHYLFLSKYAPKVNKWIAFGYIKINPEKGIKEYIELGLNGYDAVNAHGHIIKVENNYYQTIYAQKNEIYDVLLLKSSDYGMHWQYDATIYSGETYFNETSGEYFGNGLVKVITRKGIRDGMVEFVSTDYGKSWSQPYNISTQGTKVPYTLKNDNRLYLCYTDRNDSTLKISYQENNKSFINPKILSSADNNETFFLGYSPILFDNDFFYTLYADHQTDGYKSTKTYFLKFNKKYLNFDK